MQGGTQSEIISIGSVPVASSNLVTELFKVNLLNGNIDYPYNKDYPAIRGTIRHQGNASGFSFYSQGANSSVSGSGGFTFYTTNVNSANASTDAAYRKSMVIAPSGNVAVFGKLEASEIKVTTTPTADYVFDKSYLLPSIIDVEAFIKKNNHLPEIASATEMQENGVNMGEFQIQLLKKIEELTLYIIDLKKENDLQKVQIEELKKSIDIISQ